MKSSSITNYWSTVVKIRFFAILVLATHFYAFGQDTLAQPETHQEQVRYEILTLNSLFEMIDYVVRDPDLKWPLFWRGPKKLFRKAAEETVGDIDSEYLKSSVVDGGITDCLFEAPVAVWKYIPAHRSVDPRVGALGVWQVILTFEPVMRTGNKEWFEWMYAGFTGEFANKNPNRSLYLAVNTLRQIPFERSPSALLEIQLFFALRVLRCLYLWNPGERADNIENFVLDALHEISSNWLDIDSTPLSKNQIKEVVLDEVRFKEITTKILKP